MRDLVKGLRARQKDADDAAIKLGYTPLGNAGLFGRAADRIDELEKEMELKDRAICELGDLMETWKAIAERSPVEATDEQIDAALDAFFPTDAWRINSNAIGDVECYRNSMRRAIAVLSQQNDEVSLPSGVGEALQDALIASTTPVEATYEQEVYRYAASLATSLWEKFYKETSPQWKPLDTTLNVLTQIDNMIAGLKDRTG